MAVQTPAEREEGGGEDEPSYFAEINITPLTDVVLVLLIIFMVASGAMVEAARSGQLGVELPYASSAGAVREVTDSPIVVSILRDGRAAVSGEVVADAEVQGALAKRRSEDPKAGLLIEADGELAHKRVVWVIDIAQQVGFEKIGVAVAPEGE